MTNATACHGVGLRDASWPWGTLAVAPLADATLVFAPVDDPTSRPLWTQSAVIDDQVVERRLHLHTDGRFVLSGTRGPRLAVDTHTNTVTVDDGPAFLQRQLIAAFGLPMLLHSQRVLVLHGTALQRGDDAVVLCGESGAGKSTALVTLTDAGWVPLSEDACAISVDDVASVWPGPPWVRVHNGEPGPRGAALIEQGADKTAWSLADCLAVAPAVVRRVVLLEAPEGDSVAEAPVASGDAIAALARHAVWLDDPGERTRALFGLLSALVSRVTVSRLRLPRSNNGPALLCDRLDQALCG